MDSFSHSLTRLKNVNMPGERFLIVGGAGFIGSHFTDRLLAHAGTRQVTIFDNFSSGREWHYEHHLSDERLHIVHADVNDRSALRFAMRGHDVVIHLAANPDGARSSKEPDIDFREGTSLTHQVVETMRLTGTPRLLYASDTAVYGNLGDREAQEDHGPLLPLSTLGASKLAGEALIGSYCFQFGLRACAFRFGDVVGTRQTRGIAMELLRQLMSDPTRLRIPGNGSQRKSFIHVEDIVDAVLLAHRESTEPFNIFNAGAEDCVTVAEVAQIAIEALGLQGVHVDYSGSDRKGDVTLNTDRMRRLGWTCRRSTREALKGAMDALLADVQLQRLWSAGA